MCKSKYKYLGEHSTAAQVLMGDNKPSVTAQQNFTDCTQASTSTGALTTSDIFATQRS